MTATGKGRKARGGRRGGVAIEGNMERGPELVPARADKFFPDEPSLDQFVDGVLAEVAALDRAAAKQAPKDGVQADLLWSSGEGFVQCEVKARRTTDIRALVSEAYKSLFNGMPEDHVVIEPKANEEFIARCRLLGANVTESQLNRTLLNVRKAGLHAGIHREPAPKLPDGLFHRMGHAGEMAARLVQLRARQVGLLDLSVDQILCDPTYRSMFDSAAARLAPGFAPYQYRLAALAFRKAGRRAHGHERDIHSALWTRPVPLRSLDPDDLPEDGTCIYSIAAAGNSAYIAASGLLRSRLMAHLEVGAGNYLVPQELYPHEPQPLTVRWLPVPEDWTSQQFSETFWKLKRRELPLFNLWSQAG